MTKLECKNRLRNAINEMSESGADRFIIMNALTELTLDFMKETGRQQAQEFRGAERRMPF